MHIVFDIGSVLVEWDPRLAWADSFESLEDCEAFLRRVDFDRLNLAGDAGVSFTDMARLIADPEDAARLAEYVPRYTKTIKNKIVGTWDILYAQKDAGHPVHAITNWSAETWPEGLKVHPELGEVFETTLVSGQVGMIKPSVAIFKLFCERAGVEPGNCVFIDDGLQNVAGAKAAGMDGIHFTGPDALGRALRERGLL